MDIQMMVDQWYTNYAMKIEIFLDKEWESIEIRVSPTRLRSHYIDERNGRRIQRFLPNTGSGTDFWKRTPKLISKQTQ
jgi:hypothetical protein